MIWKVGEGEAYGLLATLLAEEKGLEALPAIARREDGKPYFPGHPGLHFSLSHSDGLALCACSEREIGVDIERLRPRRAGLPAYALSEKELAWAEEQGGGWPWFYTLWTLKEARVKCTGEGLRKPPREIPTPLLAPGESMFWEGFSYTALGGADWRGALCERLT